MTVVKIDSESKILMQHKIYLINYAYFMFFEIYTLELQFKKLEKKTQVVNVYNYKIRKICIKNGNI